MKPEGIRRSVRSVHRLRETGDAPSIGKVSRVPSTGLPKTRRGKRKSKGAHKRSRRREIAHWTLLIGGAAVVCLGLAIWLGLHFKAAIDPAAAFATALPQDEDIRVRSRFPSPSEDEALDFIKKALEIREVSQLPIYFRHGVSSPEDEIGFLRNLETTDGRIVQYQWLGSMDANGLSIDGVVVAFEKDGAPRNRLAALVPDDEGKWRIDFDAFARTVTPSWADLMSGAAKAATVRVYVAADNYYNGPFSDDENWLCVALGSPDIDPLLLGYCKAGSPQAAAMKWIFSLDAKLSRAVVEIQRVEGAEPRQFMISKVIAEDWLIGDGPFDRRFE